MKINVNENYNQYVLDPDNILSGSNGTQSGIFGVYVVTPENKKLLMYIGEADSNEGGFKTKISEHLKYWLSNPKFYCGVKPSELESGTKYLLKILSVETSAKKRYQKVQDLCETMKPYLQCGVYPKFDTKYRGFDLCIFPTYRRRAFVVARDGFYHEDVSIKDMLYTLTEEHDLSRFTHSVPEATTIGDVEFALPKGSKQHLEAKKLVEEKLGITSPRGCTYKYLVRIIASAVDYYNYLYTNDSFKKGGENMNYDVFITEEESEKFDEMYCNYDEIDFEDNGWDVSEEVLEDNWYDN